MNIDDALNLLRDRNQPVPIPFRLPSEDEVAQAESDLQFPFPPQFRRFQLEASDIVYGIREPGLVLPDVSQYRSLRNIAAKGWATGVPKEHLPFCEDNGNFITIGLQDEIGYFDHDDASHDLAGGELKDWIVEDWLEDEE